MCHDRQGFTVLDEDCEIFGHWDELEGEMDKTCSTCKHYLPNMVLRCAKKAPIWPKFTICQYWEPVAQPDNTPEPDNDIINQPNHYTFRGGIEPIDFIRSNNLSFCEGSIIKYLYRHPSKNGVEDLKKARRNLDWMIADLEMRDATQGR